MKRDTGLGTDQEQENRRRLKEGIDHHKEDMNAKELEMVLKYIHSLKDMRNM